MLLWSLCQEFNASPCSTSSGGEKSALYLVVFSATAAVELLVLVIRTVSGKVFGDQNGSGKV